ncbi:MAG: AAA family ATPase, partial [Clostridia bacterium]|nr:AAA family ATPase [Clostridia bacterium]
MRELAVGTAVALLLFLLAQGVNVLPFLVLGGLLFALYRWVGLPGLAVRRFVPLAPAERNEGVTFDDIGGQGSAKQELLEALTFVTEAERVRALGIRPLRGILLVGPPGTGKTLLAKAAATATRSVFIPASGAEFVEMYAGVGAQRVRELFRRARETARRGGRSSAVVFIDELEVLGGKRGRHESHLEYDQTLNQLLVEMDGIRGDEDVYLLVIGATNRPDLLDEALTRPGRFDRVVRVELPDREGRRQILELHTRNKRLAGDVDLDEVARETFGFSGAHLESLANEAAILALREGEEAIHQRHLLEAVEKVIMGEKLDRRPTEAERYRIAVHESGHALVGEWLEPGSVASITIASRGEALGYVRQAPQQDPYLYTQEYLENQICRALGGSVAERLVLGGASTGAASDFDQALSLAERMIEAGMTRLGVVSRETLPPALRHRVLSELMAEMERRTQAIVEENRERLEGLARELLARERLGGAEVRQLLGLPSPGEAGAREGSE